MVDITIPNPSTPSIQSPSDSSTPSNPPQDGWFRPVMIALGIGGGLFFLFALWWIFSGQKSPLAKAVPTSIPVQKQQSLTTVSGTINVQGYTSPDAYIAISERRVGDTDFKDVVSGLVPGQDTTWSWKDAHAGVNYEIKALLKIKGKAVDSSPVQVISAPATGLSLLITSEQDPPAPSITTISGTIDVQGFIPIGSTIEVLQQSTPNSQFVSAVTGISPSDNIAWSWSQATSGQTYQIKARLKDKKGNIVSNNNAITITAPATNQVLSVTSTANPPAPTTVGLSGTITINGTIPANSYITLGTRPTGVGAFNQVASNLPATNGVSWSWTNAQAGVVYDVQAYLWTNGQPAAASQIITDTAPSTNDSLTINAQVSLPAPANNTISINCGGQQANMYQATVNYNTGGNLPNPQQFTIVLTLASQGTQAMNTTVSPANPSQSQSLTTTYILTSGATYYAQYAYAQAANPSQFSPLSVPIQFSCN